MHLPTRTRSKALAVAALLCLLSVAGCTRQGFVPSSRADGATISDGSTALPDAPRAEGFRLALGWVTPHGLAVLWQCESDPVDFDHYRLCAVSNGGTRCATPTEDPGLTLPDCSGTTGLWHPGVLFGLEPTTDYSVWLEVHSPDAQIRITPSLGVRTPSIPNERAVIFDDALPPSATMSNIAITGDAAAAGSQSLILELPSTTTGILSALGIPLPNMTAERFANAYLEMFIQTVEAGTLGLRLNTTLGQNGFAPPASYAAVGSSDRFQRIQIPLGAFYQLEGNPPDFTDRPLEAALVPDVDQLILGSPAWNETTTVYIDEIAIWY